MANNITTNPWILDTTTTSVIWPCTLYVDHYEFVDYTNDMDTCTIKNGAGVEVWKANGASDLEEVRSGKVGVVHGGLYLSQLSAGKVRVFLGRPS